MSWPTQNLGSIIETHGGVIQTGPFGSQLHEKDYTESGIPVVMPKDIKGGCIDENSVARIPEHKAEELSRHMLPEASIVFPRRGDIGKCAYIDSHQAGFLCGTGCIKIGVPEYILRSKFLFYYLGLREVVEWLQRNAIGSTMLNLNTAILGGLRVPIISVSIQDEIVSILSAYDDLIKNNRRRIQLLEKSARLLYKEWFVRLRFPGHEHVKIVDGVPEGWKKKLLGEVVSLKYGKALKQEDRRPGSFSVYGSSGIIGSHHKAFVSGPGIILGRKGNVGSVYWSENDYYPIDTVYFIDSEKCSFYLYYVLSLMSFISTHVAVPGLSRDFALSRQLLIPDSKISMAFEDFASQLHRQINSLQRYNSRLASARDILLPRLMNGEIAV